jgi:hypothetical protein
VSKVFVAFPANWMWVAGYRWHWAASEDVALGNLAVSELHIAVIWGKASLEAVKKKVVGRVDTVVEGSDRPESRSCWSKNLLHPQ